MNKIILFQLFICLFISPVAFAGDDASGPISYSLDLSQEHSEYKISEAARKYSTSLVTNLKYNGEVVHFVRTTLRLKVDNAEVEGSVYHAVEKPEYYYVVNGDMMLKIGKSHVYSPGVGGFSMHMPRSKNFIVCFNLPSGGVPSYRSSSVTKDLVTWKGHVWNRFD